jgi:5-methyltetrahydrofolate--homocysteine methyltransferase
MPLCVQELHARGLAYPVLAGGAAINPSFVRSAAFVDDDALYGPGLFYCKDAFEGLSAIESLVDPDRRGSFVRARHEEIRAGVEKRARLKAGLTPRARRNGGPSRDVERPRPAALGVEIIERIPLEELYPLIDRNTLYRLHWGAKNASGEDWDRLVAEEFEPRLARYQREASEAGWLRPRGAFGLFPAAADGDALVLYDPADPRREVGRFELPRQPDRDRLCLADYFAPAAGEPPGDVAGIQIVSLGHALLERSAADMQSGEYAEGYYLHGFGVRIAEAAAEWIHRRVRAALGVAPDRGLRYSWGYGACPDVLQHQVVFDLLPARERLEMDLTEAGALVPELATAALVVHHPEARYFST